MDTSSFTPHSTLYVTANIFFPALSVTTFRFQISFLCDDLKKSNRLSTCNPQMEIMTLIHFPAQVDVAVDLFQVYAVFPQFDLGLSALSVYFIFDFVGWYSSSSCISLGSVSFETSFYPSSTIVVFEVTF